jgi:uncharacterized protein (DUF697 family)
MKDDDRDVMVVRAEPVLPDDGERFAHLRAHRGLIVRRALLASAIRGFFPVPVADDLLCRRIHAGLLQKLASLGQVDLTPDSAAALAQAGGPGAAANLSISAVAALVAKFAGRKFLALLAAGRSAEDMARTFLRATLFDHYCARLHVGGPITTRTAQRLAACLDVGVRDLSAGPVFDAFREGARQLGRSLLEAPGWVMQRMAKLGERFVHSGGNPDVLDAFPEDSPGENTWLDRAAQSVENALSRAGSGAIDRAVRDFEQRWREGAE